MFIGDVFVAQGLVTQEDIAAALDLQNAKGGGLGDCLVELGKLNVRDRDSVVRAAPAAPHTVADTGVALPDLLNLLMKAMYVSGKETPSAMADCLKLTPGAVEELLEAAQSRHLVSGLGAIGLHLASELRYELTDKGRQWANDAMRQNQYVGPAPVSLAAFRQQIARQPIENEKVDRLAIERAFADLVVSEDLISNIGPAINSGSSVLLYGSPGNGKTTISERVAKLFRDIIYVPYCFEVDGQIIKVFDPGIHKPVRAGADLPHNTLTLHLEDVDLRWEACWRPVIVTGGELTLEMLDLSYNSESKFYEAPLHIKALGGVFVIDDFGRQLVTPTALLNRWIVPLDNRTDYLKLHTGKSVELPFDELVIFSTNLAPNVLMDAAFLRRIPYKIEIPAPSAEDYRKIFKVAAKTAMIDVSSKVVDHIISELRERNDFPLANYQPKFIIDQVLAACKFAGVRPQFQPQSTAMALNNMYTKDSPGYGAGREPSDAVSFAQAA